MQKLSRRGAKALTTATPDTELEVAPTPRACKGRGKGDSILLCWVAVSESSLPGCRASEEKVSRTCWSADLQNLSEQRGRRGAKCFPSREPNPLSGHVLCPVAPDVVPINVGKNRLRDLVFMKCTEMQSWWEKVADNM